ncbi:hypothetical protein, partial [uncultured Gemmiger sp.]|uniref:hypothetical protein n=1 Tax=uncultured Gemmiger sp. TaxID=1623490 RepID=UPI0025D3CB11
SFLFGAQFGFPYPPTAVQNRAFQHDNDKLLKRQSVIAEKSRGGNAIVWFSDCLFLPNKKADCIVQCNRQKVLIPTRQTGGLYLAGCCLF